MTYLEFQVEEMNRSEAPLIGSAQFVIDDEDPRECVRRAVAEIRSRGWIPIMLREAHYSIVAHELRSRQRVEELFSEAAVSGYACTFTPATGRVGGNASREIAVS